MKVSTPLGLMGATALYVAAYHFGGWYAVLGVIGILFLKGATRLREEGK